MNQGKRHLKTTWAERNYNDWNFGMYPTEKEIFRRKCVLFQVYRFMVLSLKFKKTAAVH
jgi:hypothetical protein